MADNLQRIELQTPAGSGQVSAVVIDGLYIMQGDMVIGSEEQGPATVAGVAGVTRLLDSGRVWPGGVVPWQASDDTRGRILDAIWHFNDTGMPVYFVERNAKNAEHLPDYIEVHGSNRCVSWVGRKGGTQWLELHPECGRDEAIHELCHALGLYHEQARADRDQFVQIHWDNIPGDQKHNFQIAPGADLVGEYDYQSIMHYERDAFAINPFLPTITPLQNHVMGQRIGLSEGDRQSITRLYGRQRRIPFVPAHRYWNGEIFNHYYTSHWNEFGEGANYYAYERIEWWMLGADVPGLGQRARLARYYSADLRDHCYRIEWLPGPDGYLREDADCFVFADPVPHAVPIFEYYHAGRHDHHYTTLNAPRIEEWEKVGVAFYAFPTLAAALAYRNAAMPLTPGQ